MGTIVKEKDGRYRVRIRRKVRGIVIDKSARFERMTDARKWDQQIEAEITAGKFFKTVEAEQHTLNDAIERYKQHLGLENPRRLKTVKHLLDWWSAKIGHHLLADLTQALIAEKMDDLRKQTVPNRKKGLQYTNATVNRYKSALQSCLNMAVSPWCWMEDNPAKKIKNFKEPPGRDRFLNKDELSVLLDQCQISENPYLHAIVVIALSSGARREEIRTIKWADVFLDEGKVVLRKTKNKKNRTIHLAHHALAEIALSPNASRINVWPYSPVAWICAAFNQSRRIIMQTHKSDIQPSPTERMAGKRIVSVNQVPQIAGYQWLTKHALRHMIFAASPRYNSKGEKAASNGMEEAGVIIRLGRKVLIDLDRFDQWLEQYRQG